MNNLISHHIAEFRRRRNFSSIFRAIALIIQQKRVVELVYGLYHFMISKSSPVYPTKDSAYFGETINKLIKPNLVKNNLLFKEDLKSMYSGEFPIHLLQEDFRAKRGSVVCSGSWLILGEYSESARLCFFTNNSLEVINYYNTVKGVRHIHSVHKYNNENLLISTGDSKKFLDLWVVNGRDISFLNRLMTMNGGFTASVEVDGEHYFGSDFSSRPNYILRLKGRKKFFFPKESYTKYVISFYLLDGRYIMSLNEDLSVLGGRKAVSVFDVKNEMFVYSAEID